jgi:small subunit ribosomal protein S1
VVRNTTNFGAFVQIEPGIDGLVHKNELVWKPKSIQHPSDVVSKNDEIDVMIKGINTLERKITLSHRECIENPWDAFVQENTIGTELKAKVVRIGRHELFMETEDGFSAIIDKQSLAEPVSDLDASFNIGDVLEARIRYLNNDAQLIELTQVDETEAKPKPKAAAPKKESRERAPRVQEVNSQVSAATLGDDPELAEKLAAIQKAMDAGQSDQAAEESPAEEPAKPKARNTAKTASKSKKKKDEEEAPAEEASTAEAPEASGEEEA